MDIKDPLKHQVGGTHYKDLKIQPIEYIIANNLGWCEGNIVKYITRHHSKNGIDDVLKVIHYAELLLKTKYNYDTNKPEPSKTNKSEPPKTVELDYSPRGYWL